jgi:DNA-binding SARP family transcriptional activator/TolB-like protein
LAADQPSINRPAMFSLELFGGASIQGPDGAVSGPATQRHRLALLALLATTRAARRDKLAAYLWPERSPESSRKLLNQGVHALRRTLGREAILSAGDELRLGACAVQCDVVAFEAALADGELERAVDLYSGPFLDGFYLGSAPEFEHWVERERQRLAGAYARALERLAQAAEARDDAAGAVEWWKARAAHDPYDSRVALGLMRAQVATGNPAGALQHAVIHRRMLEEGLGTEPGPEFLALAEQLRDDPAAGMARLRALGPVVSEAPSARAPAAVPPDATETDGAVTTGTPSDERRAAAEVAAPAPPGEPRHAGAVSGRRRNFRPVRRLAPLMASAALVILAGTVWWERGRAPSLSPHRVAVATFENRTGDPDRDPIGPMAADLIRQGLLHTGLVEVASQSAPARTSESGGSTPVRALAEASGSGLVVSGSYYVTGDSLRFQAQLTDVARGRVLSAFGASEAVVADPTAAVEALRQQTLAALALVIDGQLFRHAEQRIPLPTYDAYRAYRDGNELFLERRWAEAIEHFERAIAMDTTYPAPRLRAALAHRNLGARAVADSLLRELDRSKNGWGAYDRAYLAMLMTWLGDDQAARFEATKRLAEMSDWAVPQAGVEAVRLNRPREAIKILARVDPARDEHTRLPAWYWIALTDAHHMLGDHRTELRTARRARALVPDDPMHLFLEARALAALGRLTAVEAAVDARSLISGQRDPDPGVLMVAVGHELRVHGHTAAARAMYARALEWHRARSGDEQALYQPDLARVLLFAEEVHEARAFFEQVVLEEPENTDYQGALAVLAARRGEIAAAERIAVWMADEPSPSAWTSPGFRVRSNSTYWRACIAAQLDRPAEAISLLEQALTQAIWYGHHLHTDPCLDPLRDHPLFRELMRPKG